MSYIGLALNLNAQRKYAAAQPLFEKALEINRKRLTDEHPRTARLDGLAPNLDAQGKYAQAQPLHEQALEFRRRLLDDDHPAPPGPTAGWRRTSTPRGSTRGARPMAGAVRSLDKARLRVAFTGLDARGTRESARPPWPPCWPGSVGRRRRGRRWRRTSAAACSTSWSPDRTNGSHPPSEPASAN